MKCGKAPCGIRYAVRRGGSAVGYCALSIRCGTRDEQGYHSGIAHLVEHTLFKGTERKNARTINGYLDRLGGELNAYTTKEEIVLHATVLKEDLPKAASLLFELATSPVFPAGEIETEKGVVIDEINSYKDSPSEDVYDRFEEMLFAGHPLSGPILGTVSSVRKTGPEELKRFVKEKFVPEEMAFTIVADLPEEKMEKTVLKLSGKFFGQGDGAGPEVCSSPAPAESSHARKCCRPAAARFDKTVSKRNHQVNCVIGGTAPSLYEEKERIATILLCNILGGPATNSILNSVLREKNGWVYGVECSYTQYADTGIVAICLGCDKDNLDRCFKAIDKEITRLQAREMNESRLKAAKKQLLGQLAISSDNGETQCLSMGKSLLTYGMIPDDCRIRGEIEAVTASEIKEMACRLFSRDNLSRLIFI